jgi:hypothetical protein
VGTQQYFSCFLDGRHYSIAVGEAKWRVIGVSLLNWEVTSEFCQISHKITFSKSVSPEMVRNILERSQMHNLSLIDELIPDSSRPCSFHKILNMHKTDLCGLEMALKSHDQMPGKQQPLQ